MNNTTSWDWQTAVKEIDLKDWNARFNWTEEFQTSPDGEKIAAIVNTDEAEFTVCVNGQPWDTVFEKAWALRFLPDGRLVVLAANDEEWTVCTDGTPWENRFDYAWDLKWSDSGGHIAVAVQTDGEYGMAVNDTVWDTLYENITGCILGSNGTSAAVVQKEPLSQADTEKFSTGIFCAAVDGTASDDLFMNVWDMALDETGEHLAYVVRKNRETYSIVQDGRQWQGGFQSAWQPVFMDQGRALAAPVREKGKWYLYKDGDRFWENAFEQLWKPVLSPDGRKLAAIVSSSFGKWTVCEDRENWNMAANGMISDLAYSPDGTRLAAVIKHNGTWDIAVNGRQWGLKADKLWAPITSRDGRVTVTRMVRKGKYYLVANGYVHPTAFDLAFDPEINPSGDKILLKTITDHTYTRRILNVDDIA